jgi:predicted DCC family thiol-disulfide oxidoreductase YuxK
VEFLRTQDRRGALEYLPAQSPEVGDRFSWLQEEALLESLHLVDPRGGAFTGARAVEELVRILPGWRWGGWVFRLPLVRPLVDRGYRWVAARRIRSGCADHC